MADSSHAPTEVEESPHLCRRSSDFAAGFLAFVAFDLVSRRDAHHFPRGQPSPTPSPCAVSLWPSLPSSFRSIFVLVQPTTSVMCHLPEWESPLFTWGLSVCFLHEAPLGRAPVPTCSLPPASTFLFIGRLCDCAPLFCTTWGCLVTFLGLSFSCVGLRFGP